MTVNFLHAKLAFPLPAEALLHTAGAVNTEQNYNNKIILVDVPIFTHQDLVGMCTGILSEL